MDAIKQLLLRVQQNFSALTASQKMLSASLMVIMVMTMLYWARYASVAEMEVLLDQSMSPEEISQIKTAIAAKGVSYTVNGDRIMVPADRKFDLLADLGFAQLLPRDMKTGFDEIVAQISPMQPQSVTDLYFNHAKERTLSMWIGRWPGVKQAAVMIDGTNKQRPGHSITPTAAVSITLKSGEQPSKRMVEAAADLLIGAQAGLNRGGVKIAINGVSFPVADKDQMALPGEGDMMEARANAEKHYVDKIIAGLQYIPSVYATVSVDLKIEKSTKTTYTVDPKNAIGLAKKVTNTSEDNNSADPAGEPGAQPNIGLSADATPAGKSTQEVHTTKDETENVVDYTRASTTIDTPAGDAPAVAAAVRIPESYLASVWKRRNPTATKEPEDKDLDTIKTKVEEQVREMVKNATNIKDDASISVASYTDIADPLMPGEASKDVLASLPLGIGFGAREIAIGVLAVVSLFMVSMMVKKSVPPAPVIRGAGGLGAEGGGRGSGGPDEITASAELAGEVGEIGGLLTGAEMSESDIESKQVIEQVGTLVKENPESAANLINRWMTRA